MARYCPKAHPARSLYWTGYQPSVGSPVLATVEPEGMTVRILWTRPGPLRRLSSSLTVALSAARAAIGVANVVRSSKATIPQRNRAWRDRRDTDHPPARSESARVGGGPKM